MLAYAVAQTGAFLGFVPLLSILLPLKVQALDPSGKAIALSPLLIVGGLTASGANIFAGWLSDRSNLRGRSRAAWIAGGAVGMGICMALMAACTTWLQLMAALVALQVCLNLVLAPLSAVLTDRVPDAQKGRMAGWLSMSAPLATLLGMPLMGGLLRSDASRYGVLAAIVVATILPFAARLGRDRSAPLRSGRDERASGPPCWRRPEFQRLWTARFCMQCAIAPINGYLLFYVEDVLGRHDRPEAEAALLLCLSTVAGLLAGPILGHLSESRERRSTLALIVGATMAAGLALLASGAASSAAILALLLIGAGFGGYTALDTALAGEIVAPMRYVGRNLGLLNLAHTLPQVLTPLFAWAAMGARSAGFGYPLLFGAAALLSLIGGIAFKTADARETPVTAQDGAPA